MPTQPSCQLVYLVYGNSPEYRLEAKFSMLTALRTKACPRILLYTDKPEEYTGWPVSVIALDDSTLGNWTGAAGYIHRRKACAFADALNHAETSIFIDTDTFFQRPAAELASLMAKSDWIVDKIEARFGDWSNHPLYQKTSSHLRSNYRVTDDLLMINSGILGMPQHARALMDDAITVIDELYPLAPKIHIIEQFAASIAARNLKQPNEARNIVFHYYSEKEYWRAIIRRFFEKHGEEYHKDLPEASREVPTTRPKPHWWHRLSFKTRSLVLRKSERRFARLAYYALHMPDTCYAQACNVEYCRAMAKQSPDLLCQLRLQTLPCHWRYILSKQDQCSLTALLERINH